MATGANALEELKALVRAKEVDCNALDEGLDAKLEQLIMLRGFLEYAEANTLPPGFLLECAQKYYDKTRDEATADMEAWQEALRAQIAQLAEKERAEKERAEEEPSEKEIEDALAAVAARRKKAMERFDKEEDERRAHREAQQDKDRAHEKARELKRVKEDEDWEAEFAAALRDRSAKRLKKLADAEAAVQNSGEFH
jgi:hypothetical protein